MAGRMSFCNHRTAYCPSPYSCRGTFSPTLDILTANQGFPTHSAHSLSQSPQKPLTSSKKPSLQQTQQPPKTHHPTHSTPPYHSMATESAIASTAGQTPRFRKAKRAELSTLKLCHDEKRYHKMEPSPKTTQNHSISSFCPQTRTITLQQRHTTHPIDLHYI